MHTSHAHEPRGFEEIEQRIAIAKDRTGDEPAACEAEHVAVSGVTARDPRARETGHRPHDGQEVQHEPEYPCPPVVDAKLASQ